MTEQELAYIAGLIDGEGCLSVGVRKPNSKMREKNVQLVLQGTIQMCNKEVILWLQNITGFGRIYEYTPKNIKHNVSWSWIPTLENWRNLLPQILPYLIVKKEQAKIFLELLSIRNKSTRNSSNLDLQLKMYSKIKILNKRGK